MLKEYSISKGGEQSVIEIAKRLRASSVIVVDEHALNFSIEASLGGKLLNIKLPKNDQTYNINHLKTLVFKCLPT